MATVFKRNGRGNWLISWFDHAGKRREKSSRTTDKRTAEQIAAKLEHDVMLRSQGLVDPQQDIYVAAERKPLTEHLDDYRADLLARGNTSKYAGEIHSQARRLVVMVKADRIGDLTPDKVHAGLKRLRDDHGLSLRTCNKALKAIKQFSRWLYRNKRSRDDGLSILSVFNEATDQRHKRRELSESEIHDLIEAAKHGPVVMGMSGVDRAMVYRVACGSGLRSGELASLTHQSFELDADPPTIKVQAAYSKHRRDDVQPIRDDLADLLRPWLASKPTGCPVFALPGKTAKMIRHDLKAAGIAYRDDVGRVADFHSLRHSYVSALVRSGSVKTAQQLARHSTPTLTIGRYSHVNLHDVNRALDGLPSPQRPVDKSQRLKATGTHGRDEPIAIQPQQKPQHFPQQSTHETVQPGARRCEETSTDAESTPDCKPLSFEVDSDEVRADARGNGNDRAGTRTQDQRLKRPMLYQLSYPVDIK